jgi:hypothetical protein
MRLLQSCLPSLLTGPRTLWIFPLWFPVQENGRVDVREGQISSLIAKAIFPNILLRKLGRSSTQGNPWKTKSFLNRLWIRHSMDRDKPFRTIPSLTTTSPTAQVGQSLSRFSPIRSSLHSPLQLLMSPNLQPNLCFTSLRLDLLPHSPLPPLI